MALKFFIRVYVNTSTTGQGTLSLGAAVSTQYLTAVEAGVTDGDETTYIIEEGGDFEVGRGVIGGSGTTITRATVYASKIAGTKGTSKMTLGGNAKVLFDISGVRLTELSDLAPLITAATAKTTPVDADLIGLVDSAASNVLKKITWANVKATLIETGSNANGRYARFSDGTQICWVLGLSVDITSLLSSPIYRGFIQWTLPASFASTSYFGVSSIDSSISAWGGNAVASTASALTLRATATSSQSGVSINGFAAGRWF